MSTPNTELDQLFPQGSALKLSRDQLTLYPLKIGQLPAMLRAVSGFADAIQKPQVDWLGILAEHGEALLDAIAIGSGKPRTWIDGLGADDALLLIAKVVEVNADFFAQAVLPKIETLFQSDMGAKIMQAGEAAMATKTTVGSRSSKNS
jgi:hypothetical protein